MAEPPQKRKKQSQGDMCNITFDKNQMVLENITSWKQKKVRKN